MVDKEYIRKKYFVDGWSIWKISKSCRISRQTVRKMLDDVEVPKYLLKSFIRVSHKTLDPRY